MGINGQKNFGKLTIQVDIYIPYDPAIPILDMYPIICIHKSTKRHVQEGLQPQTGNYTMLINKCDAFTQRDISNDKNKLHLCIVIWMSLE